MTPLMPDDIAACDGARHANGVLFVQAGRFLRHQFDRKLARGEFRVYVVVWGQRCEVWRVVQRGTYIEVVHTRPGDPTGRMLTPMQPENWLAVEAMLPGTRVDMMGRVIPN